MTVKELIETLKDLGEEKEVYIATNSLYTNDIDIYVNDDEELVFDVSEHP